MACRPINYGERVYIRMLRGGPTAYWAQIIACPHHLVQYAYNSMLLYSVLILASNPGYADMHTAYMLAVRG